MAVIVADDFSPIVAGDVGASFAPQFLHKDLSAVNLSGATVTMVMVDAEGNAKNALGTWVIDDSTNGKTHYVFNAADVAVAGDFMLYITITISGLPVHADNGDGFMKHLEISPAPTVS
jgi:hypothetical protein